jgi:hypothetical protein
MDSEGSTADFIVIESDPGDSKEKVPATPQVDSCFNFQLVVFQVYSTFFMLENILIFVTGWRNAFSSDPKCIRGPGHDF